MTKQTKPLTLSRGTPAKSADKFLLTRPHLLYQQGEWMDYSGGAYIGVEEDAITAAISIFCEGAKEVVAIDGKPRTIQFNPKPADVRNIRDMLQHKVHKNRDTMSPPCWLDGREGDPKDILPCRNGLLNIKTRELTSATPMFFTRTCIPVDYDANAPTPKMWLSFLFQVTKGRKHLIQLIREMMGYFLSADTSQQRVFFFLGASRGGKGTIIRILSALLGMHNVAFSSLETLGGRFGLQGLIGKSALVITDMNSSNESAGLAASRINAISGEDAITAERKNSSDWTGLLRMHILLAANAVAKFGSQTNALMGRLIVIPFDVSFKGKEDRHLTAKLLTELPGILNWCLDGLDMLHMTGEFQEPKESLAAKIRIEHMSEPLHGFIAEHCEVGADYLVEKTEFYEVYCEYAAKHGLHQMATNTFGERLIALGLGIGASRPWNGGERMNAYSGVKLLPQKAKKSDGSDL